jgi:hypothetical protein
MFKLRGMRWEGHVARMGDMECTKDFGGKARKKETTRKN